MTRWQASIEALRGADHVRRRARLAMEMTVEERLREAIELCRVGAVLAERWPADVRERALRYREPPAAGAESAMRRLLLGK